MIRLFETEFTRLRWRRAVQILVAAAIVITGLVWASTIWDSRPYDQAEVDQAIAQVQEEPWFQQELRRCERHPERWGKNSAEACAAEMPMEYAGLFRQPLSVAEELNGNVPGVITMLSMLAMLIGATAIGADWNSGSMSNQLLFEPRRLRVWWAKALTVGAVMAVIGAVLQGLYWLGIYAVSGMRDIEVPAKLMDDVWWMIGRGSFLVGAAAVAGFALTMLFRNTVFTLGLLFVVAVAGTFIVAMLPLNGQNERYMVHANVGAVERGFYTYYVDPGRDCYDRNGNQATREGESESQWQERCSGERTISVWGGLGYLAVPFVLGVGGSLLSFRRRDVP